MPDEDVEWTLSHLRPLAGVEDVAGRSESQEEAFAAWRGFLEGIADQSPLVLVFEDLHWADEGLLDFVDHLVDWATRVPLLVVGTARPELLARRSAWGGGKTNALTLSLAPLSGVETAELVHGLLDQAAIPADIQATLLERAGGNPLYAEEFVRLLDERANGAALPETVQGIIAARLDVLDREEKELLQDAAVLGRVFWVGGLGQERDAAEAALHRLERREFVQRERRSTVAGETEYAFRHALVREVAYEQIPRAQRGEKHRRVATWLETLGRPDDLAELLAHHYIAVLDYSEPDAELAGRAARALGEAGDRALALNAYAAAAGFYRRALDVGGEEERGRFLFGLGNALEALADAEAVDRLVEASATLLAAGDPETAAEAETILAEIAFRDRRCSGCRSTLAPRRRARARRVRLPRRRHGALGQAARFAMLDGRWSEAIETGGEAERMAAELGLDAIRADALATLGTARDDFGEPGGDADLELAIELAEAANAPLPLSRALNNLAWRYSGVDLRRTYELQQRNYETMRRYGHVGQTWWARGQLAGTAFELGRWDEALEHAEAVLAYVEAGTPHYFESCSRFSRAAITFARGDDSTFAEDIDRSLELAEKATDPQATAPVVAAPRGFAFGPVTFPARGHCWTRRSRPLARTEIGIKIIEYDVALVAAMLDLDREQLGVPPVAPLDARSRAAAALYEQRPDRPQPTRLPNSAQQATRPTSASAPGSGCSVRVASRTA